MICLKSTKFTAAVVYRDGIHAPHTFFTDELINKRLTQVIKIKLHEVDASFFEI